MEVSPWRMRIRRAEWTTWERVCGVQWIKKSAVLRLKCDCKEEKKLVSINYKCKKEVIKSAKLQGQLHYKAFEKNI